MIERERSPGELKEAFQVLGSVGNVRRISYNFIARHLSFDRSTKLLSTHSRLAPAQIS